MKKAIAVASAAMSAVLLVSIAGCGEKTSTWYDKDIWMTEGSVLPTAELTLPENVSYGSNVSVHDPSVFYDDVTEKYYAFGTHFSVASSSDLITWKQEIGDGSSESTGQAMAQKLYGDGVDWRDVLAESVAYAGTEMPSTWAPDVMKIGGIYYMYYSLTSAFGSAKSVIGRVSSTDVLGPYSDEEIIIKSTGATDGPNCIDPTVFYDKDGKLWMVYGSHYAGIYIKELDSKGLPVDDGYGTLLWKGSSTVVEGPYIFYNAELGYYYLMTTYGDLSTNYNMRVARSENPDGPYVDVAGKYVGDLANNGNKLAGNYVFEDEDLGYAAQGHNSVIKVDGRYLVVYHTRYLTGTSDVTGNHNVRVSQLYFNEDGWPVMSPARYAGEEKGLVTEAKVAGDYEIVVHSAGTTAQFVHSVRYTLGADGTVTNSDGDPAGTWSLKEGYYLSITIGGTAYSGVVCAGWRLTQSSSGGAICLTATSASGLPLWGQAVLS